MRNVELRSVLQNCAPVEIVAVVAHMKELRVTGIVAIQKISMENVSQNSKRD